jgi:hypothetical protein
MDTILDVSDALIEWERQTTIKTVTTTTIDFVPTKTVTSRMQPCVVQVAEKEKINLDTIDWSLEYLMVHSRSALNIDELVQYDGRDYVIKQKGPWRGYGYHEVVAAETKRPLVEVTA